MAYDEGLAGRIAAVLDTGDLPEFVCKKMFGGVCYMVQGNMLCGVYKTSLIARVGPSAQAAALAKPGARPFDITGRPMKGWVMVGADALNDIALETWIDDCLRFVLTLPAK